MASTERLRASHVFQREYECLLCDCKFFTVSQYNVHIQTYEHRKCKVGKISAGECV